MILWLILAAILIVTVRLWPRAIVFILIAVAVVGTGIFAWTRHIDSERAQIAISVTYDPSGCPAARPMSVTIRNTSPLPLERVTFSIHARKPGYSSVVTPYTYKQYESDKIIAPGESFSTCYPKPLMDRDAKAGTDEASLEWSASVDNVYLR